MPKFKKSCVWPSTVTSQQHGIMTSPNRMMKNTCLTIVIKYQSSSFLQRKDINILVQAVAKQRKLRSNGHLTYHTWGKYELYCGLSPQCHLMNSKKLPQRASLSKQVMPSCSATTTRVYFVNRCHHSQSCRLIFSLRHLLVEQRNSRQGHQTLSD